MVTRILVEDGCMEAMRTDHDTCISVLERFFENRKDRYRLLESHKAGERGPNLLVEDIRRGVTVYVEVELDAKSSRKARSFADRAEKLFRRYGRPVEVWLVASSEKWVSSLPGRTGVRDYVERLHLKLAAEKKIEVKGRISALSLGKLAAELKVDVESIPF